MSLFGATQDASEPSSSSSPPRSPTAPINGPGVTPINGRHMSVVPGRPSNACLRCKGRKTKCSCERPNCASCIKANVNCEYPAIVSSRPTWDYVRQLEARLMSHEKESRSHNSSDDVHLSPSKRPRPNEPTAHLDTLYDFPPLPPSHSIDNINQPSVAIATSLVNAALGNPPDPLPRADAWRPGPPSISQLLDSFPRDAQLDAITLEQATRPANVSGASNLYPSFNRSTLPSIDVMEGLINYFLTYNYSGYLLVHGPTLRKEIQAVLGADVPESRDLYFVFMVLAIACTSQARGLPNSSDLRRQAHFYWNQAQPHLGAALSRSGLGKLQAVHLMLQFVLHNPESGTTIRIAIDLGLHHENHVSENRTISLMEQDLRRKLFWATYCIDRNLSTALGRPPGIPDEWINARFPSPVSDDLITEQGILDGLPDRKKEGAIHHARLRILQSKIHHRLYTVVASQSAPPSSEWFASMEQGITSWREAFAPDPTGFANLDWLDLQYHITRCLLFRPNPGNRTPTRPHLTIALHSSSFIMRLYREMYRRRNINYIWQAIHHLFLSGVTYLNSLWIASRYGWDLVPSFVEAMLDIQACSCCLEAMTMHEHGTTGIRDAFETVSAAVIRRLSAERSASGSGLDAEAGGSLDRVSVALEQPGLSNFSTDPTLPAMDFSWLLDPSRPASPAAGTEEHADNILDSFLLHPFVGLDQPIS